MELELERPLELRDKERTRKIELQRLKKKNHELATITRKLEEKVKTLEKVNLLFIYNLFSSFKSYCF